MWGRKHEAGKVQKPKKTPAKYYLGPKEPVSCPDDRVEKLHRVIASRDIPRYGVKAGDSGGYVDSEFNLAQEGDAWIGGNACVIGMVKVQDNALVTDDVVVRCTSSELDPYSWIGGAVLVKDKATISGTDFNFSGNVKVLDNASVVDGKVAGNAVISDNASISKSTVVNKSIISGHALLMDSFSGGFAQVGGNSRVAKSFILGQSVIRGQASIIESSVSGNSIVEGQTRIEKAKIRDDTHISGNVKIKENTICEGKTVLSGDLVIPPNYYVMNKNIVGDQSGFMGFLDQNSSSISNGQISESPVPNSPAGALAIAENSFISLVEGIESEYKSYSTDIVKLIKYPVMADPSIAETQEFLFLLRKAKRLFASKDKDAQQKIAEQLERAYMVAEANALKVSSSLYSDEERKKTEDAKTFIARACDENSTIAEKKISFRSTMKALEGVVPLPEEAINSYREKVGLLEIEA